MKKKCPTCNKILPVEKTPAWPFCSNRCRMVDLGKWMNEDYRVAAESKQIDSEDQSEDPQDQ